MARGLRPIDLIWPLFHRPFIGPVVVQGSLARGLRPIDLIWPLFHQPCIWPVVLPCHPLIFSVGVSGWCAVHFSGKTTRPSSQYTGGDARSRQSQRTFMLHESLFNADLASCTLEMNSESLCRTGFIWLCCYTGIPSGPS
jgi:hypothetical protein